MKGFQFVFLALCLLLEIYTFYGLRSMISEAKFQRIFTTVYAIQFALVAYCAYSVMQGMQTMSVVRSASVNLMIGILFTSFITKIVFASMLFIQDGGRMVVGGFNWLRTLGEDASATGDFLPSRRKALTQGATFVAAIPFLTLLYGLTVGKYKYTLKRLQLAFSDLPPAFDGLRIVQISDIHAGSLDSIEQVEKAIDMINAEGPDLILFTGDLVNSDKEEINPYIASFARLEARYGKYAVLGNHDYYGVRADMHSAKYREYFDDFEQKFRAMGFELLKNRQTQIVIDGQSISLLGVENWGAGRYFQKYGDLDAALTHTESAPFKILMSHDPTHWDHKVLKHHEKVHLTLSGHTHGMQFGINLPGLKWSPVKYRYDRWMGLYEEDDQYLYVNPGFGFLGFPGRVGIWPEITSIELKAQNSLES